MDYWRTFSQNPFLSSLKNLPGESLDGVIDGQHVNALAVADIGSRRHADNVTQANTQVVTHHAVHPDLVVGTIVVRQHDRHRLLSLLALKIKRIS